MKTRDGIINSNWVSVFSDKNFKGSSVTVLEEGTRVKVLESDGLVTVIDFGEFLGFINSKFVDIK